jgi:hypothetical protein
MFKFSHRMIGLVMANITLLFLSTPVFTAQPPESATEESSTVTFTPPTGWRFADSKELPPNVKVMVVGKGKKEYPPSINLATEKYNGTLKDYLKTVKAINDSQSTSWKDLGTIQTASGNASLSQIDTKTTWGDVRMMHVIIIKDGTAYILTAASLTEEFPKFYKDFFNALRSLRIETPQVSNLQSNEKENKLANSNPNE